MTANNNASDNIVLVAPPSAGPDPRAHWPQHLRDAFEREQNSGIVGSTLVSETDIMRVWHLHLAPGARCGFHRHVLDYFWTAMTPGRARGYYSDGRIQDVTHFAGETRHYTFGPDEFFVHSVENIGDSDLLFTTVEFLQGANRPIAVPDSVRLRRAA